MSSIYRMKPKIHKRDKYTCAYCGMIFTPAEIEFLHVDHIIPRGKGGHDGIENLTTACCRCNLIKSNLTKGEFLCKALKKYDEHVWWANYFKSVIDTMDNKRISNGKNKKRKT